MVALNLSAVRSVFCLKVLLLLSVQENSVRSTGQKFISRVLLTEVASTKEFSVLVWAIGAVGCWNAIDKKSEVFH